MGTEPKSDFPDLFSRHADCYARSRPNYPPELFTYLASLVKNHRLAWDCGTGNGQAAVALAGHFERVIATDASAAQLEHAVPHPRVEYRVARAEDADLESAGVDLVTVAQALHWFKHDAFYANVRRVAAPGAAIAVWCYTLPRVSAEVDAVCDRFYAGPVGPYWEAGRHFIDQRYETIPFPFEEIRPTPAFACTLDWSLNDYVNYLNSWSAVQRYKEEHGTNPVDQIRSDLAAAWGDAPTRCVRSPIYLRVGKVE